MIQANELRIGNYVNVLSKEQCPFRIDGFEFLTKENGKIEQDNIVQGFYMHPLTWELNDIDPIELTSEWLFKLGFIYVSDFDEYRYKEETNWFNIQYDVDNLNRFFFFGKDNMSDVIIDSVHKLQNLYFALTGNELTINT